MNQAEFMHEFNDTHREHFNEDLFKRDNQELVDSLRLIVESVERNKYFTLKLLSFETIWDYEKIYDTLRSHTEARRKKNDKTPNVFNFINIKDSDIILCKLRWFIQHNGPERVEADGQTYIVQNPNKEIEVLVALPRFVRGYYFRLNGNYYSTSFQIVDGSTYNNANASNSRTDTVTLKTMFTPTRIFRALREFTDIRMGNMKVVEYVANIFGNTVNAMFYLFAQYGMYGACQFLEIDCVAISNQPNPYEDYMCFEKNGIYVSCHKEFFKDAMVQSLVASILDGIYKDTTLNDLFNQRYWLRVLGMAYKNADISKGLFVLDSIDGIYDKITRRDLHLKDEDKEDIYTLFRWICREFSNLKLKENTDVRTKRIRLADYVSAPYAVKLNTGMYRVSDLGKRVTLTNVIKAVYTQPMFILNSLTNANMSNLVSYRDLVNDGDASTALRFTFKGISGLGEKSKAGPGINDKSTSTGSVQKGYRYIDPSHLGIIDMDTSSNSDPGMGGMLCPLTNLYQDHSFTEYDEPDTWRAQYGEMHKNRELVKPGCTQPIHFKPGKEPTLDYKNFRTRIEKEELEITKLYCPIHDINTKSTEGFANPHRIMGKDNPIDDDNTQSLFTINIDDDDDDDPGDY